MIKIYGQEHGRPTDNEETDPGGETGHSNAHTRMITVDPTHH